MPFNSVLKFLNNKKRKRNKKYVCLKAVSVFCLSSNTKCNLNCFIVLKFAKSTHFTDLTFVIFKISNAECVHSITTFEISITLQYVNRIKLWPKQEKCNRYLQISSFSNARSCDIDITYYITAISKSKVAFSIKNSNSVISKQR